MKAYALIIDHESCWGCKTCEVACKQENLAPTGVKLISVWEEGPRIVEGKPEFVFRVNVCRHCDEPEPEFVFRINVCRHCDEPECIEACPEEAIFKRDDGIVVLDQEKCVGCELCLDACPYDAIAFDAEEGIAQKCNLCYHRVDQGLIPACADNVCLAHCIYFGDPKEIQEHIAEAIGVNYHP
jgi:Fe-S-cluster-containing dehydrogenase component